MTNLHTAKMTVAGQISIPKPLREDFCQPGDHLTLEPFADGLLIRRIKPFQEDGTIDDEYIKQAKQFASSPDGESIDWEVDETPVDKGPGTEVPSSRIDEAEWEDQDEATASDEDRDDDGPGGEDSEEEAQKRKEMWKALLDSRAI